MKVTLFSSNQPRHLHLAQQLSEIVDELFFVSEVTTIFPGHSDDFYKKSEVMKTYFNQVRQAEMNLFGEPSPTAKNTRVLPLKMHDLSSLSLETLKPMLDSDLYIVFGSSWIRGPLCDFLIAKRAINIHMGVSPFYRGTACNFWSLYDKNPHFVGATIHLLSKGLDSGEMLFHALPQPKQTDGFSLGMRAVRSAINGLSFHIKGGTLFNLQTKAQDKSMQIRYSRNSEFTDEIAARYLDSQMSSAEINQSCMNRNLELFLNPFIS